MTQAQFDAWLNEREAFKAEVARRIAEIDARIDASKMAEGDVEIAG